MTLDELDQMAAEPLDGFLVRKDLVRRYARHYPVPTYVVEFLLGRYCASTNEEEISEGLRIVEQQLGKRTVRSGEKELFKAQARNEGSVKLIDSIRARLDARHDCYLAELPSLALREVQIGDRLVRDHERMLTDGFYAEITLKYDALIAQERNGRPFYIEALRPIQLSTADALQTLKRARRSFSTEEWIDFLIRSIGLESASLNQRAKQVALLRMIPFVEPNFNLVELGPRGTGKSHLFQQISPYSHLVSGGKASVAKMFVNNANSQRGLVCLYDVVCFDEVAGIAFDQRDGVNIMKGYMAAGEFSRGKESIRAQGSIVMVGNFDVDLEEQQRNSHLFGPLPGELRNDTAFHDRIHAYVPGWDFPKLNPNSHLTNHFGMVSDFLSECWNKQRLISRTSVLQNRVRFGSALSGRDIEAVIKTVSGLTKLLFPDASQRIDDADMTMMLRMALESRRRVKEQQRRILKSEFRNTHFSFYLGTKDVEQFVSTPELHSDDAIDSDPLPAGQIWTISPGSSECGPGLFRVEVASGPGNGVKILNSPMPSGFRESVRIGEQNLYAKAKELVGERDPRSHAFSIQMRAFDSNLSGTGLGLGVLVALVGNLLEKTSRAAIIVVGQLNLGGSIERLPNAVTIAEIAIEKKAHTLLMPVSARKQLMDLPDAIWTKVRIEFYSEASDAVFKALID